MRCVSAWAWQAPLDGDTSYRSLPPEERAAASQALRAALVAQCPHRELSWDVFTPCHREVLGSLLKGLPASITNGMSTQEWDDMIHRDVLGPAGAFIEARPVLWRQKHALSSSRVVHRNAAAAGAPLGSSPGTCPTSILAGNGQTQQVFFDESPTEGAPERCPSARDLHIPIVLARVHAARANALEAGWERAVAPHRLLVARCGQLTLRILKRLGGLLPQRQGMTSGEQLGEAWGALGPEVSRLKAASLQLRLLARGTAVATDAAHFPWA